MSYRLGKEAQPSGGGEVERGETFRLAAETGAKMKFSSVLEVHVYAKVSLNTEPHATQVVRQHISEKGPFSAETSPKTNLKLKVLETGGKLVSWLENNQGPIHSRRLPTHSWQ